MKIAGKTYFIKKDCKSLSIYEFCAIIKLQDFRYLIKGFNEKNEDDYIKLKSNEKLLAVFEEILIEYKNILNDTKQFNKEKSRALLDAYIMTYDITTSVLKMYKETKLIEVLDLLNSLGFTFDATKLVGPQLDKVLKAMVGMKNTIKIRQAKYDKLYKETSDDGEDVDILFDLEKKAISLEIQLGLSRPIKTKKTTVVQWINLFDLAEEKNKAHGQSKN